MPGQLTGLGGLITASFTLSGRSAQVTASLLPALASGYNRTLPLARWHPLPRMAE